MKRRRGANKAAGDMTEQEKNAAVTKRRRGANKAAGDRTEQESNTRARQKASTPRNGGV